MNIMHIVNCWWIPRIRMIHGLAYTHYWYAPCLSNNDVVFTPVNCDISASRSCCSASNATKFFNSIDAVILHHVKDLIECSWEVSRCFIYGHSGINIIIILINMMMIQLLKCIIETLMCGGTTMVALTKCCDNVLVTYMEEYGDTEVYCDNVIEFHDTSSSLPLPSLSGSGIHSSQK